MKSIEQIENRLKELREENDANDNKDSGWNSQLATSLRARMEILNWVLENE